MSGVVLFALVAIAFALGLSAGIRYGIVLCLDVAERWLGPSARAAILDHADLGPWRRLFE